MYGILSKNNLSQGLSRNALSFEGQKTQIGFVNHPFPLLRDDPSPGERRNELARSALGMRLGQMKTSLQHSNPWPILHPSTSQMNIATFGSAPMPHNI
jgi:hypothetical protein